LRIPTCSTVNGGSKTLLPFLIGSKQVCDEVHAVVKVRAKSSAPLPRVGPISSSSDRSSALSIRLRTSRKAARKSCEPLTCSLRVSGRLLLGVPRVC
jgi:hypothetical protein